jgi:hypothetical protein
MKRIPLILVFIIFPFFISFSQSPSERINLFLETSIFSEHKLHHSDTTRTFATNTSFSAGFELILEKDLQTPVKFGIGILYQFPTKIIGRKGDYSFVPVYGFIRINFLETDYLETSAQMRLGYNFFSSDGNYLELDKKPKLGNGLYFSLGSIINVFDFQMRLFYSINYGTYKSDGRDYLITNNQFTAGIGLFF